MAEANANNQDPIGPPPQNNEIAINAMGSFPRLPIPAMSENNIDAYFMSIEFWFRASGITDDNRKYYTVMSQITPTRLIELRAIIEAVPNAQKYNYIKAALTSHFAESEQRRLRRVLSEMPLGDNRPSQLYHSMQRVAGNTLTENALVELWSTRLPTHTHAAIAASTATVTEKLKIADAITESMDLRGSRTVVAEVQAQAATTTPQTAGPESDLIAAIRELNGNLRRQNQRPSRNGDRSSRTNSQSKPREVKILDQKRRDTSVDQFDQCWFHRKHGKQATTCRLPCTAAPSTNQQSTQ